ncbi:unnamed protein product [Colias eurytheme]|nr:unnamed protein product [Colias eurytheme]
MEPEQLRLDIENQDDIPVYCSESESETEEPSIKKKRSVGKTWVLVSRYENVQEAEKAVYDEKVWSLSKTCRTEEGINMPRLLESEITKYLETLEDSEDGLDGSDSEVEDEGHYYQTARDVLRDLENNDEGENAQSDEVDADPPLVIDNDQNMPDPPILEAGEAVPQSRSQGISKRPLVWRKRNLVTAEDSLIFRGETQITEALMSCNTPLFKIRPLEEMLNCQFGKVPLDQRLSIDEQMCATKMSHYIKQYMPNKPHKWGFKLYLICSLQGYAHRFEVYSGGGSKNNILPGEPDLGESGNTVVRLARMVPRNVNHIIYFDNFYTSVPLVTYLAKEGIFSLGTVRVNRLRNCKLPDKNTIMKKNVPRGFYEENVATVDDIDVSAVVWKDNKPVNLLSTYVGAEPATTVTRFDKSKKERVAIPCPKVIKEYNAHMGGVDLLDSFIGRYHITMKSRKWTMRLFYHFLDLAVINSWVMFKKDIP